MFDAVAAGKGDTEAEQRAVDSSTVANWCRGRLRGVIAVRELVQRLNDRLTLVMSWYDSTDFGELIGFDRECARRLVRKMPSSEVPIELQTALHRDSARASRWQPNDVTDIGSSR